MRPSEVLAAKREEVLAIIARYPVTNPRLFGSVARGEDNEESDVDILVDITDHTSLFDLGRLEMELMELLGRHVDLATPGELRRRILPHVLAEQKPL